jgi:hypothetical protein
MEKNKSVKWIIVAVIAALVAAATTVILLALRAKAKKKAWYEQAAFEYDMDDCEGFDDMDEDAMDAIEELQEIPAE